MKAAFPFIYVGQGPGKPPMYELYLDIKFEREPDKAARASIQARLPQYLSEDFQWNGPLLSLKNSEIGGHVKEAFEPDWTDALTLDEAFDKDSELWLSPKKDSWERFNQQLDRWVYSLHQHTPIAFAIKHFDIPKKRYTSWHRWSVEQAPGPVLDFAEKSGADVWSRPLREYFSVVPASKTDPALKSRIVDFLLNQDPLRARRVVEEFFGTGSGADREKLFHQAVERGNPVALFALCKASKNSEAFIDDDDRVEALVPLVENLIDSEQQELIYRDVFSPVSKMVEVNRSVDDPAYLKTLKKKRIRQAARIFEVLVLALSARKIRTNNERALMYTDMLFWGLYIPVAGLFALSGDQHRALCYAKLGLAQVQGGEHEGAYRKQGADNARALGCDDLVNCYQNG